MSSSSPHVGTLREKPLHAALKQWYAEPGDRVEQPVGGFVIDLVRDDLLIEIQTRSFASMKGKLAALLEDHPVRIVHPVATDCWIIKRDAHGTVLSRRLSPKHGDAVDVVAELVSFPAALGHPGFTLDVLLVQQEEVRHYDSRRAWRRKGWVVDERRLLGVTGRVTIESPADLAELLPASMPEQFTTADLAAALHRPRRLAQQMAYCLRQVDQIAEVGRRGNAIVYART